MSDGSALVSAAADAAMFLQLADAMPQIVFAARPDGHVDYFNRRWYDYTGLRDGEVGIDSWRQVHTEDGLRRVTEAWNESLESGNPYEIEYLLRRHDGVYRWHLGRALPVRDGAGNIVRWFGTNTDIHDHKIADEAAERARAQMELVVRGANVGVWYCPLPFDRLIWDTTVKDHFFIPHDVDVTIELFYDRLHPDDRERTRRAIEASIAAREPYDIDYRTVSPDGRQVKWIRASGRGFYDAGGNPVRFDGITIDVTERTRAAEALRESEARFRHMSDNAPVMIWVTDASGACVYLNKPWYDMTGQREAEGLGLGWVDAVHPDDRAHAKQAFLDANARREPFSAEYRLRRHRDGTYRWCIDSAAPRYGAAGEYLGYIGSVLDITDRKAVEEQLRESEERLRLAIAIAQMGTFQIDLRTDAVVVNEPGRAIYGFAGDEPLTFGRVQRQFHPGDREMVMERVADAFRPDGPGGFEVEQRIIRLDGAVRWIRVRGRTFFDGACDERSAVRCVGTYIDVTQQKEHEHEREQLLAAERISRAEAERASRMKDEFLATLSHELRTPLNAILGWATILSTGGGAADAEDLRQGLETIERNARAQTQIIEDLLDMSRIISGKVRLDVQGVDLADAARSAVETVRPAADAKGIRLHAILDPHAGPVSGDPGRLQQVLWNLLSNAIKFTPRGGHVQLLLARVNSHVELSVHDTGEGITADFLPHVFDRFRQADASTTRRHGGLGLGLAIVKQLVELHGGTVTVASPGRGRGSTFTVALPLSILGPEPAIGAADRRHPHAPAMNAAPGIADVCLQLGGVKVLVVDDEPDARSLLSRLLADCQAVVTTAGSADEAIERLARDAPDVLVSDIGMPGEDGYSLIRRVRALPPDHGGATPAVALTAYARAEDRMRSILAGFQMHVAKPVEPAELITMVASLAGRTGVSIGK